MKRGMMIRILALSLFMVASYPGSSENINQPAETLPSQKFDKVFDVSGFDRVNIFSGDLQMTIPIGPEYPVTAGFGFQLSAHYSSKFWRMVSLQCSGLDLECGSDWAQRANVMGDPTLGVGWSIGTGYVEEWTPPGGGQSVPRRWLQSWNGTRQDFGVSLEANDGSDVKLTELAGDGGYIVNTPDGTKWYYTTPQDRPEPLNEYDFLNVNPSEGGELLRWGLSSVTDKYGNAEALRVTYKPTLEGDWKIDTIVLAGGRTITFNWGTWNSWPVLTSVTLPAVGPGVMTASFGYDASGNFPRGFEGGAGLRLRVDRSADVSRADAGNGERFGSELEFRVRPRGPGERNLDKGDDPDGWDGGVPVRDGARNPVY